MLLANFSARRTQGSNSDEKKDEKQLMHAENSCGAMAEIRAVASCVFPHQIFAGVCCSGSSPMNGGLPSPAKANRITQKCIDY